MIVLRSEDGHDSGNCYLRTDDFFGYANGLMPACTFGLPVAANAKTYSTVDQNELGHRLYLCQVRWQNRWGADGAEPLLWGHATFGIAYFCLSEA